MLQVHLLPLAAGNKRTCCVLPCSSDCHFSFKRSRNCTWVRGVGGGVSWIRGGIVEETGVCADRDDVILWLSHLGDEFWAQRGQRHRGGGEGHELPSLLLFFFPWGGVVWGRRASRRRRSFECCSLSRWERKMNEITWSHRIILSFTSSVAEPFSNQTPFKNQLILPPDCIQFLKGPDCLRYVFTPHSHSYFPYIPAFGSNEGRFPSSK